MIPRNRTTAICPSRRQVMIGSAATATVMPARFDGDPAVQACNAWQASQAEYEDLTKRWQALESHIFRNHNWCRLSRRQRAAIPESAELDAIDDRRDELHDHKQLLLMALIQTSATTPRGLAAKLTVATSVVHLSENAEGHGLVASVLRDFQRFGWNIQE